MNALNTLPLPTEHLSLWASAVRNRTTTGRGSSKKIDLYGIKKLRELILELAVRGKLVPQNPEDEPASALLERIVAKKTQLVKEKKIKKPKKLPEIIDDEKLFDLPQGWQWIRLGELFNSILSGGTPSKREPSFWNGNIPWASVKDLGNERYITKTQDYITESGLEAGSKLAAPGDLLICTRMGLGKIGAAQIPLAFNQDLKAVKLASGIDTEFFLNAYATIKIKGTGTIVAGIKQVQLLEYVVAWPPEAEQHRIVTKVNELMSLCDQLEQETETSLAAHTTLVENLLATLTSSKDADELTENWHRIADHFTTLFTTEESIDQLKQTVLQLAVMGKLVPQNLNDEPASVLLEKIAAEKAQLIKEKKISKQKALPPIGEDEKPFELPEGWEWCRLDDLAFTSEAGWSPRCELTPREGDRWGVLKVSAVTWGVFKSEENKELPQSLEPRSQYEVKAGDFLISRANTAELVARAVVVPEGAPKRLMMSDKIIRFEFSQRISSHYINLANNSVFSRSYYSAVAGGTSSSMKNVSRNQIRNLVVALPPHDEELRIIEKVEQFTKLFEELKTHLQQARQTRLYLADAMVEKALG